MILGSVLFLCASGMLYYFTQVKNEKNDDWEIVDVYEEEKVCLEDSIDTAEKIAEETIKVYICGAVQSPGVYEVKVSDRLVDLVDLCEGLCEDADKNALNLAAHLNDGEKIYIMTTEEANTVSNMSSKTETIADGRININTADVDELMSLPGIGKAKAEHIIAYREKTKRFESVEEITSVDGIKNGVYEKIKELIKIE